MRVSLRWQTSTAALVAILAAVHGCGDSGQGVPTGADVWAWGAKGLLGDGPISGTLTPVQVVSPGGAGFLADVRAVAAGLDHTVAVGADGTVWTRGDNSDGQLDDGTTTGSTTPVPVAGPGDAGILTDVSAVAAGEFHTVALVP